MFINRFFGRFLVDFFLKFVEHAGGNSSLVAHDPALIRREFVLNSCGASKGEIAASPNQVGASFARNDEHRASSQNPTKTLLNSFRESRFTSDCRYARTFAQGGSKNTFKNRTLLPIFSHFFQLFSANSRKTVFSRNFPPLSLFPIDYFSLDQLPKIFYYTN